MMRTYRKQNLVTLTALDKNGKELKKEVVFPIQYDEAVERMKKVEGIAILNVKTNYYKNW